MAKSTGIVTNQIDFMANPIHFRRKSIGIGAKQTDFVTNSIGSAAEQIDLATKSIGIVIKQINFAANPMGIVTIPIHFMVNPIDFRMVPAALIGLSRRQLDARLVCHMTLPLVASLNRRNERRMASTCLWDRIPERPVENKI